jgi:hypothetical protein
MDAGIASRSDLKGKIMYDEEARSRLQRHVDAVIAAKAEWMTRPMGLVERAEIFLQSCRAAEAMEANRRLAGLPPCEPPQWSEATWDFLRELTRFVPAVSISNQQSS